MSQFHVVIPAAGFGSRMGATMPKQYLPLAGQVVIAHTLQIFLDTARIDAVHLILSPQDTYFATLTIQHPKLHVHYCGGETRAETVRNGLDAIALTTAPQDWLLVHDAARPCLSKGLLHYLIDTLHTDAVGGLLAIPLAETLKRSDQHHKVLRTEPRDSLWQAQTPQMFRYQLLRDALAEFQQQNRTAPTDEAQAIEAMSYAPHLISGHLSNLKITYPNDLALAELILNAQTHTKENAI